MKSAAILDVVLKVQSAKASAELKKFDKQLSSTERSAQKMDIGFDRSQKSVATFGSRATEANSKVKLLQNTVGLIKFPALIAGAGGATQALAAVSAGAGGLVSALAPLSGLLAAYPALIGAFGQAMGVTAVAGLSDVTDAVGGLNEKLDETSDEFKNLSPQAQEFARSLQAAKAPLLDIQSTVQRPLFEGLNDGLDAATKNMPVLRDVAKDTASVMGDLAREAGKFAGREGFGKDFAEVGQNNAQLLGRLGEAGMHFADALRHVVVVSQPLIDFLGKGVVKLGEWLEAESRAGRESGRMAEFFERTEKVVRQLVSIGGSLASVFMDIGHAARPLGEEIMAELVKQAEALSDWTGSHGGELRKYFEDARQPLWEAGRLVGDLVKGFFELSNTPGLTNLIKQFRKELLPVLIDMTKQTTKSFGPVLIDTLVQVGKLLTNFLGSSGPLVHFVKLFGNAAEAINDIIDRVPVLGQILATTLGGLSIMKLLGLGGLGAMVGRFKTAGVASAKGFSAGFRSFGALAGPAGLVSVIIDSFEKMSGPVKAVKDFGNAIEKTFMESLGVSRHAAQGIIEQGNKTGKSFDQLRAGFNATRKDISNDIEQLSNTWGQNLSEIRQKTQENMQRIRETMGTNSRAGRQAISDNFFAAVQAIKNSMKSGEISAEKGAKAIHNVLVKQLKSYGIQDVEGFINRQEAANAPGNVGGKQKGGLVTGAGSGDKVPLHVGGRLTAMVEPGEYVSVANRKATNALMRANKAVPRFAKGGEVSGMQAMVDVANAYEAKGYPYVLGGGHGDIAWPDTEPVDCSGAVSAVLSAAGLLDTPMVSGALASWGKAGTGPLTVYANSGHTFMSLDGKFFGTSSSNPSGGAGWMSDPGASYISGFAKRTTDVAGGSAIASAAGNVKLPRFSSDFGLGLMVAQGLNNMAAGTEKTMNKRLAAQVPSGSVGGGDMQNISGETFVATSYGPPWGGIQGTGITATGVNLMDSPQIYGVAVDPDVIALGSKMRIGPNPFNYGGLFKAFDTGGAIQGNRIDFYDWRGRDEQLGWGTRDVEVEMARRGGLLRLAEGGSIPELFPLLGAREQDTRKDAQERILRKIGQFGLHPDTLTRLFQGTNALAEHQEYAGYAADRNVTDANDNLIPGLFREGTEHSWLVKAREEAWTLRENLIKADTAMRPQIEAFENKDGLIKKAEKRLKQVRDALHDAQVKLKALLEEIERQRDIIEDARAKLELTGNKELSESQKKHQRDRIDAAQKVIENITGQRVPQVENAIDRTTRERDALVDPVMPALAAKFEELRAIKDGIRTEGYTDEITGKSFDSLKTIQGTGSSMDLFPMPDDLEQRFGGTLHDIQMRLIPEPKPGDTEIDQLEAALSLAGLTADLSDDIASQAEIVGYWERELARLQESSGPASEIGSAANSLQSARDALASLQETTAPEEDTLRLEALMAENARLRMSAQQAGTFAGFFRQFQQFATGGVVGDAQPVMAHVGEGIFTREQMSALGGGRGDVNVNVNLDGMDVVVETWIDGVLAKETRKALSRGPTVGRRAS